MGRILAIDYGGKRTGLAVTDPLKIIATPLDTVETKKLLLYLKDYFAKEEVEEVIIGLPKRLNNTDTHGTALVEKFLPLYRKNFNIPISTIDERFTSKMAAASMIESGVKKKDRQKKENLDKLSATIILQGYLLNK